jgi:hypothetical protein
LDNRRVGHSSDAPSGSNISWHSLQRHDRDCTGLLSYYRLLGVGDIHYHAALLHLGEPTLQALRTNSYLHNIASNYNDFGNYKN